jgi:hypothetical protein
MSTWPSIALSGSVIHVAWYDLRNGNYEIYYKRSTDGGVTWGAETRLTNDAAYSTYPSLAVSGANVHLVWYDTRDGNSEIYYKLSTNGGVSWGTDIRLTNDPGTSLYPFIVISNSVLHVIWADNRDGNYEIYYKRNPTGNPIGIVPINSEIPSEFELFQNYPNPFNPTTNVQFSIINVQYVTLKLFDILGKEVATLINEKLQPGTYEVTFDGSNLASGIYFYRIEANGNNQNYIKTMKALLIK